MEFRALTKRVPRALFPGGVVRIHIGDPATAKERKAAAAVRDTLKALARMGDWDVLRRLADRDLTPEEVHAAVKRAGVDSYRAELHTPARAVTLGAAVEEWKTTLSGPTGKQYRNAIKRLVASVGAETPMDSSSMGRTQVRAALRSLEPLGLAHNTRAIHQVAWSSFFSWWVEREAEAHEMGGPEPLLGTNPIRRLKAEHKVRARSTRHRFLTEGEWERLSEAASPEIRTAYATLLFCGLRPGEMYNLRPADVGLPRVVRIRAREEWKPKGYERWDAGEGDVPIHQTRLLPLLEEHGREWAGERFFFVNPQTGDRWDEKAFRARLRKDCGRIGLVYGRDKTDGVTPHTFRHTIASWLAQRDVQLMKIAQLLRDRPDTVSKHYAHLLPKDLDETLNRVI